MLPCYAECCTTHEDNGGIALFGLHRYINYIWYILYIRKARGFPQALTV